MGRVSTVMCEVNGETTGEMGMGPREPRTGWEGGDGPGWTGLGGSVEKSRRRFFFGSCLIMKFEV